MSWVYNPVTATSNLTVRKNGTLVGTRPGLNFIEGSQVSLTAADDAGNSEIDLTIASTAGASQAGAVPQGVFSTYHEGSLVLDFQSATGSAFNTTTSTFAANLGVFVQVNLTQAVTAYKMAWVNGATLSGNIDVGIYDEAWNRLVSSAPQTQAGTSTVQVVDITDTALVAGTYFLAFAVSSATATFRSTSVTQPVLRACGCAQQASLSSGTLPNPAVPATLASSTFIPMLAVVFQNATF
jgi:hypothetical protein